MDVAIFREQKGIGVGMIMRDEAAQVVGCHMKRKEIYGLDYIPIIFVLFYFSLFDQTAAFPRKPIKDSRLET